MRRGARNTRRPALGTRLLSQEIAAAGGPETLGAALRAVLVSRAERPAALEARNSGGHTAAGRGPAGEGHHKLKPRSRERNRARSDMTASETNDRNRSS